MDGDSTLKDEECGIGYESSLMMLGSPDRESSTNRKKLGNTNSQVVFEAESAGDEDEETTVPIKQTLAKIKHLKKMEDTRRRHKNKDKNRGIRILKVDKNAKLLKVSLFQPWGPKHKVMVKDLWWFCFTFLIYKLTPS